MKSIGTLLFILGAVTIVLGFLEVAPRVLLWIYNWGEGIAWLIKIGLVITGMVIYLLGSRIKPALSDGNSEAVSH